MKKQTDAQAVSDIIIYQTEDHQTKVQVRLEDDTVWLNLKSAYGASILAIFSKKVS
jgi:hypothetical protein